MIFDAQSARALVQRTQTLAECLAAMKTAIVEAARVGEFEARIGLPEPLPIAAGQSTNNAAFLIDFFTAQGCVAWADAIGHAVVAGYAARPLWQNQGLGAAVAGMVLSWSMAEAPQAPGSALLLMPAVTAHEMSLAEQVHQRWVEGLHSTIRDAAQKGKPSVTVHDRARADDPAWAKRREILQRAGYSTELLPADTGALLVIGW